MTLTSMPVISVNFLNKIFSSSKNLYSFKNNIKKLSLTTPVKKIFEAINSHSSESEIRYVGGCLRKILNNEKVDDIDLATNLNPLEVTEILKKNNIISIYCESKSTDLDF